ncbi:MAG: DUF349 domain-containing protein [Burkholderiales bacterium]|nr:DUF349 domain-containing protein [Burkholderiales bacterium]
MLDWIFKKNKSAPATERPAPSPAPARPAPTAKAAAPAIDWPPQLQAALGDDAALLALARGHAPVDVKLAAVNALGSEAALKLAERELRDTDRRVHRLAKQRHGAQVLLRETAEQAGRLIEAARALVGEAVIPSNRLVELDRGWRALDAGSIDAQQRAEFDTLLAQLSALTRERGDQALALERRASDARAVLARLQAASLAAADGTQDRSHLAEASEAARAVLGAAPDAATHALLRAALQAADELDARLAVLEALLQDTPESDLAGRWQQFAPLPDAALAQALNQRFAQWQQARDEAQQTRRTEQRERARERARGAKTEHLQALATALERAETTLAEGQLGPTHQHLVEIDELLHGGTPAGGFGARIDAVQAGYTRLKGWQHWGGGLARDELVLQAEALAATTLGEAGALSVKLSVKEQAGLIDDLRARWKELDRLGGATSRALWQRFEAALKTAHGPVAAHLDVQRAARQQNLQSREQLIEALNGVVVPDTEDGAPDWKTPAVALDRFETDWRRLGPLEHTVPHKQRDRLVERMRAAVSRIETPLNEARRAAQRGREQLVARAAALAAVAATGDPGRDLFPRLRELQAEWQQHAASLPLPRALENALWGTFKGHIDAVFSARDAAFNARDAEFKAHGAERAALIERLAALGPDTPPAELQRTLGEVESAWQRAGPAPRNEAVALDSQFRNARDNVRQWLATSAQRRWHGQCDALLARLAACEQFEAEAAQADDPAPARAALEQRWAELPALPALWDQALAQRVAPAAGAAAKVSATADELLLQLEAAYQVDSPPAFEAARRALKLHAMKAALESRPAAAAAAFTPDQWLAAALGRSGLDAAQRARLGEILKALRERGPGRSG